MDERKSALIQRAKIKGDWEAVAEYMLEYGVELVIDELGDVSMEQAEEVKTHLEKFIEFESEQRKVALDTEASRREKAIRNEKDRVSNEENRVASLDAELKNRTKNFEREEAAVRSKIAKDLDEFAASIQELRPRRSFMGVRFGERELDKRLDALLEKIRQRAREIRSA